MICFHKWGKWGEATYSAGFSTVLQYRACDKCGKIVARQIRGSLKLISEPSQINRVISELSKLDEMAKHE